MLHLSTLTICGDELWRYGWIAIKKVTIAIQQGYNPESVVSVWKEACDAWFCNIHISHVRNIKNCFPHFRFILLFLYSVGSNGSRASLTSSPLVKGNGKKTFIISSQIWSWTQHGQFWKQISLSYWLSECIFSSYLLTYIRVRLD